MDGHPAAHVMWYKQREDRADPLENGPCGARLPQQRTKEVCMVQAPSKGRHPSPGVKDASYPTPNLKHFKEDVKLAECLLG